MKKFITIIALIMLAVMVISLIGALSGRSSGGTSAGTSTKPNNKPTEPNEPTEPTEPNEPTEPQKGEVLCTGLVADFQFGSNGLVLEEGKGYFLNDTYFVAELSVGGFAMPPADLEIFVDGYSVTVRDDGPSWVLSHEPSCTGTVTFYAAK